MPIVKSHIIKINKADIANWKINLRACGKDFFPSDAFGGSSSKEKGKDIEILYNQGSKSVKTDLPSTKTGTPRWFTRNRKWVRELYETNNIVSDTELEIKRLSNRKYCIDLLNSPPSTLNVLSLFSGCGGMDLGFEGGFKVHRSSVNSLIHSDWIERECGDWCHLKANNMETIFANDIRLSAKIAWDNFFSKKHCISNRFKIKSIVDLVKNKELYQYQGGIDIVTGGFPCQDFSNAGKRNGFNSHRNHDGNYLNCDIPTVENRGLLYIWMRNVIEITQPKLFVAENVKALTTLGSARETIEKDFSGIAGGYFVFSKVLKAVEYGVPQTRERIFFIGLRKDCLRKETLEYILSSDMSIIDPFPVVTHGDPSLVDSTLNSIVSCGEVLRDLPEPEFSDDLSHRLYSKAKYYGRHCQGNIEIDVNKPSPTIRAEHHGNIEFRRLSKQNGGKHYDELRQGLPERRLSVRECARIQTFPDDYDFVINPFSRDTINKISGTEGYVLVGNAVPPLLAYHIASNIKNKWNVWFK